MQSLETLQRCDMHAQLTRLTSILLELKAMNCSPSTKCPNDVYHHGPFLLFTSPTSPSLNLSCRLSDIAISLSPSTQEPPKNTH